jgi:hypothetical protein
MEISFATIIPAFVTIRKAVVKATINATITVPTSGQVSQRQTKQLGFIAGANTAILFHMIITGHGTLTAAALIFNLQYQGTSTML